MPNPFPGMNPYLENRNLWRSVHARLIYNLADLLNTTMPPGFVADIEDRVALESSERNVNLDVFIIRRSAPAPPPPITPVFGGGGGTAVLERPVAVEEAEDAPEIAEAFTEPVLERFIVIHSPLPDRRIVTHIEVLSPTNKTTAGEGQQTYRKKQVETIESGIHLIEIDLLRGGLHTVRVPAPVVREFGIWDYLICLTRADSPRTCEFWRSSLQNRLPRVRVPLTAETPDAILNVQTALNRAYDSGRYDTLLSYTDPPAPSLEGENAVWLDAFLRENGLRVQAEPESEP